MILARTEFELESFENALNLGILLGDHPHLRFQVTLSLQDHIELITWENYLVAERQIAFFGQFWLVFALRLLQYAV